MADLIEIRRYRESDAKAVQDLFKAVNRLLAPPELKDSFESYIASSIAEEIGRVGDYYRDHDGFFWVATSANRLVGMFGLEAAGAGEMELRRMYVDPGIRRKGIAGRMLQHAEDHCRSNGIAALHLSTSELQPAALSLYRAAGYQLLTEEASDTVTNKTIGGGVRRYYFCKALRA
ncbi:MAG: GNAT family N-acetyltransferase [Rhizobiales bacterium]|nr:GNAT family N-acetyltransferase [Hyphomicrobiales bacterium]